MINRSIWVMGLGLVTLVPYFEKEDNPELDTFVEIDSKKVEYKVNYEERVMKITQYYIPLLEARTEEVEKYHIRVDVYKKGKKPFRIYLKSSNALYIEGYAKIKLRKENGNIEYFYLDHEWNYSKYPRTADGGILNEGDAACNSLPFGTKVVVEGDTVIVTDRGGGLKKHQIDIFTSDNYCKKTQVKTVKIIKNEEKP